MTRRLLALLAVLTGLAALHAPAHASVLDSLSSDIESLTQSDHPKSAQTCICEHAQQKRKSVCLPITATGRSLRVSGILPPSLVIGADRALE